MCVGFSFRQHAMNLWRPLAWILANAETVYTTLFLGQMIKRRLNPTNCVKLIEAGFGESWCQFSVPYRLSDDPWVVNESVRPDRVCGDAERTHTYTHTHKHSLLVFCSQSPSMLHCLSCSKEFDNAHDCQWRSKCTGMKLCNHLRQSQCEALQYHNCV